MTDWELKREAQEIKRDLQEMKERVAAMRQTYTEMEAISNFIRGLQAL